MTDRAVADDVAPVRAFWQDLGLPGLFDVHVHFLPENVQRKVYAQFDQAGPKIGRAWPIRYRGSHDERVALLRDMGVRRFSALPYAHRPGIATYLNDWARGFAERVPESLWSATFYPEPEAPAYVEGLVRDGVEVFKIHVQVGEFHLDDPALDPVWGILEESGTPIVVHAGSGPSATSSPAPTRCGGCSPGSRGSPSSSRTWAPRSTPSSWRWRSATSGSASTRPWCSPTSSTRRRRTLPSSAPGWSTSSPRCCWAATSRRFRTPTPTSSKVSHDSTWVTSG